MPPPATEATAGARCRHRTMFVQLRKKLSCNFISYRDIGIYKFFTCNEDTIDYSISVEIPFVQIVIQRKEKFYIHNRLNRIIRIRHAYKRV